MVIVLSTKQWYVGWFLSHPQTPCYSTILPSIFVDGAPRALVAKTKGNQSQERETTLLEVLCTDGMVGA